MRWPFRIKTSLVRRETYSVYCKAPPIGNPTDFRETCFVREWLGWIFISVPCTVTCKAHPVHIYTTGLLCKINFKLKCEWGVNNWPRIFFSLAGQDMYHAWETVNTLDILICETRGYYGRSILRRENFY